MNSNIEISREKLASDMRIVIADAEELLRATAGQVGEKAVVARERIHNFGKVTGEGHADR